METDLSPSRVVSQQGPPKRGIETQSLSVYYQIVVPVFHHQSSGNAFRNCRVVLSHGRDVNKQAGIGVDPSAVNDVELIFGPTDLVVWVDL